MDTIQENYDFNNIAKENNTLKARLFYNYRLSVLLYNHSRYLCKFKYVRIVLSISYLSWGSLSLY